MTSESKSGGTRPPRAGAEAERRARQAEALRANLRRRKEQARARDGEGDPGGTGKRDGGDRPPRA